MKKIHVLVSAITALVILTIIIYAVNNNRPKTKQYPEINDGEYMYDIEQDNDDVFENKNATPEEDLQAKKIENHQKIDNLNAEYEKKRDEINKAYFEDFPNETIDDETFYNYFFSLCDKYTESAVMAGIPVIDIREALSLTDMVLYLKLTENSLYYGSLINDVSKGNKLIDKALISAVSDYKAYIDLAIRRKKAEKNPVPLYIPNYNDFLYKYNNSQLTAHHDSIYTSKNEEIQEQIDSFKECDKMLLAEAEYILFPFLNVFHVNREISDVNEISSSEKYRYAFFSIILMGYYANRDWMGTYGEEDLSAIVIPAADINKIINVAFGLDGYNPEEISEYSKEKDAYIYEMPTNDGMGGDFGNQTIMNVSAVDDVISFTVGVCSDIEYGNEYLIDYSFKRNPEGYRLMSIKYRVKAIDNITRQ